MIMRLKSTLAHSFARLVNWATFLIALAFFCGCNHLGNSSSKIATNPETQPPPVVQIPATGSMNDNLMPAVPYLPPVDCSLFEDNQVADETDIEPSDDGDTEPAYDKMSQPLQKQPVFDEALYHCQVAQNFWQKGELDNALAALDRAYELILQIDTEAEPKLIQQKEDLRFLISKRILEIYASRNIVVNGKHNAIPITINKHVQAEIDRFTRTGEIKFFNESYKRAALYRPYIIEQLKQAGLPISLSWLPLIESGFKPHALSSARALGLWQFIPSTGYKFGLNRNKYIDERLDPEKATHAAIAYLKALHQIFGDWSTVLAAYNCGEGRVLRVIRAQNINYLDNFWDLYERLPRETARYVPRFIATLHIVNNPEKYGLNKLCLPPPLTYDTVTINRALHLKDVALALDLPAKQLVMLNPELRYKTTPDSEYLLKIPVNTTKLLLSKLNDIPTHKPVQRAYSYHRVRRGESLSIIAKRYRTSVQSIQRANRLRHKHLIQAGMVLKIPNRNAAPSAKAASKTVTKSAGKNFTYRVKSGDNLWIIARRYGTTTQSIQTLNHLKNTNLRIGQTLKIPGMAGKKTPRSKITYTVRSGDTAYEIAKKHHMPLNKLLKNNNMSARSVLYPGQNLYIE